MGSTVPLKEGYRLELFRDPDEPKWWNVALKHGLYAGDGFEASWSLYRSKRVALGTAVMELLASGREELVPSHLYPTLADADPDATLYSGSYERLLVKYLPALRSPDRAVDLQLPQTLV